MDKQPPMAAAWSEGLHPYTPVVRDGKLYDHPAPRCRLCVCSMTAAAAADAAAAAGTAAAVPTMATRCLAPSLHCRLYRRRAYVTPNSSTVFSY